MDNSFFEKDAPSQNEVVLSVRNLYKSFGKKSILQDISFDIKKGEIFGLLGPNGSGKTTTIKLALGLLRIDSGVVEICGYNIKKEFEKAISNVGAIIENPEMYKGLTGRQNLMQYVRMYDSIKPETIDWAIDAVGLRDRIDEKISRYSLGMRQRLGIAQALLHSPKILMLDEPTNGLDPEGIRAFREFLIYLAHEKGISVLVSSHMLAELDTLCDRVCVINSGKIVGIQTMEQIRHYGDEAVAYKIVVDVANDLFEFLKENEISYQVLSANTFKVEISQERAETLLVDLVASGIRVKAFTPIEKTLEEAFIQIVSESGGSKL